MVDDNLDYENRDSACSQADCHDVPGGGLWNDVDPRGPEKARSDKAAGVGSHAESSGLAGFFSGLVAEYRDLVSYKARGGTTEAVRTGNGSADNNRNPSSNQREIPSPGRQGNENKADAGSEAEYDCFDLEMESRNSKPASKETSETRQAQEKTGTLSAMYSAASMAAEVSWTASTQVITSIARGLAAQTESSKDRNAETTKQPEAKVEEAPAPREVKRETQSPEKAGGDKPGTEAVSQQQESTSKPSHFENLSICGGDIQEVSTPQGTFRSMGSDENGNNKFLRIAPGANDEGQEFKGSIQIKDGKVLVADAETGKTQEYSSKPVKYENLSLTAEGKVSELSTGDRSYRLISNSEGKDQYLVTTRDNPEGQVLNGSLSVTSGRVTVQDHDQGTIQTYGKEAEKQTPGSSNSASFYDYAHQVTVATTRAVAGETAAAAVDSVFKDPAKIQQWYNQAAEMAQKAAQTPAESKTRPTESSTDKGTAGEAKPISGPVTPGEAKPDSGARSENPARENASLLAARAENTQTPGADGTGKPAPNADRPAEPAVPVNQTNLASLANQTNANAFKTGDTLAALPASAVHSQADSQLTAAMAPGSTAQIAGTTGLQPALFKDGVPVGTQPVNAFLPGGQQLLEAGQTRGAAALNDSTAGVQLRLNIAGAETGSSLRTSADPARTSLSGEPLLTTKKTDLSAALSASDWHNHSGESPAFRAVAAAGSEAIPSARPSELAARTPASPQNFAALERASNAASPGRPLDADKPAAEAAARLVAQPRAEGNLTISAGRSADLQTLQTKAESSSAARQDASISAGRLEAAAQGARQAETRSLDPLAAKTASVGEVGGKPSAASNHLLPTLGQTLNPTGGQVLNPGLNQALNPSLHATLNPALNQVLNPSFNPALNPNLRAAAETGRAVQTEGGRAAGQTSRIDAQFTGVRTVSDSLPGRADALVRTVKPLDLTGRTDASGAVALANGKGLHGPEGRYMIAELTLAMVLAAGGIRRLLPTDGTGKGDGSGAAGSGRRQIERDFSGKTRGPSGPEGLSFMPASFKFAQSGLIRNGQTIRSAMQEINLSGGRQLWLSADGRIALVKTLAASDRQNAGLVHEVRPERVSLGFSSTRLVPVLAEAAGGRHMALPSEPSVLEQLLEAPQTALDGALAPLINAAHDFIEIDDPFQSFKDVFVSRSAYRRRAGDGRDGAGKLEPHADVQGGGDSEDPDQNKNLVLLRPTWLIAEGQTLTSIAEEHFSDPYIGWLIADLNSGNCREHFMDGKRIVEFQTRQQITLPVWQDIVDFYGDMPAEARPENLVTIVRETEIDREVVNNVLGPILGQKDHGNKIPGC
jgi:hypothetical protein